MSTTTEPSQLCQLDAQIRAAWRRAQFVHLAAGFLALCSWAIPLFLIGMAVDWMTYMPATGRFIILGVVLVVPARRAWLVGWRHLRFFNAAETALRIEKHHGDLESLLVTAVQLRDSDSIAGVSDALRQRTFHLAEKFAASLHPQKSIPCQGLRHPVAIALAFTSLVAGFAVLDGPFLTAGLTRIFNPWVAISYPTKTQINVGTGDLVVQEGKNARIAISISGVIPNEATFFVRTGDGKPSERQLAVRDGGCEYTLASASRDFSYRIHAGDARSDWYQVRVIPAPRIRKAEVDLQFPDYIGRDSETVEALTLTVPEETTVRWKLMLDRPVRKAVLHRDGKEPLTLEVAGDGRQVVLAEKVDASRGYSFSWVDKQHGFDFTSSRYFLQVASDQVPRVELTAPGSNLVAMIGRPLSLVARIQDDHGIGQETVVYRVNQREEELVELDLSARNREGGHPIDWDYREALPDLKTGDTVSFTLEVSDLYPGESGAHVVRSETRRMTFLSREAYLQQIQRKRDRLLSQVQTMYRQQRAAFDVVSSLDPADPGYMQTCQVEAIRQELVREQLKQIAKQIQVLIDDLAANSVSDAPEGESLERVQTALHDIAETHLANAASRLRSQSGIVLGDTQQIPDPASASRAINAGARDLASLVLLRSIDTAQEVYARETRMLAQVQASLRWRCVLAESDEVRESLGREQNELADWLQRLIADLQNGMRYEKRALAVLRLIQSVNDLQNDQTEQRMRKVANLITEAQPDQVKKMQAGLVTTLLDAEFSVRLSGAYSTLMKTRDQMRSLINAQVTIRERCSGMSADTFENQRDQTARIQKKLRRQLVTLLLPTVPAPRTQLLDERFPQPPPIQDLLEEGDQAMNEAIQQIASGQQAQVITQQRNAEEVLNRLSGLLDRWAVDLGLQTLGLSTLVAVTGERLALIEEFEAKVIALLEKTDVAVADGRKVNGLAEVQLLLAEELSAFNSDLVKQKESNTDQDIQPLLGRLQRAERALRGAVTSLEGNNADEAIGQQEQAADLLAETYSIVSTQNERLSLLQDLLMFQRSVGFADGYMTDIVSRQRDMIVETREPGTDDASLLLPKIAHLRQCIKDVAPLLDTVAARVDAGSPLAFADADLEDAVFGLESGDELDALDAQEVVAESLEEVRTLVKSIKSQTGYVAEIVEFLHGVLADLSILENKQDQLMRRIDSVTDLELGRLVPQQRELLADAEELGRILESVTGMAEYNEAATLMRNALAGLDGKQVSLAAEQMELAGDTLQEYSESLFAVISMLHGLPTIEIMSYTNPDIERLVDVLAVATAHKALYRDTNHPDLPSLQDLAERQSQLANRCKELASVGDPHPMLEMASTQLTAASESIEASDREATIEHQKAAMQTFRHFIIEQALILETAVPPSVAQDGAPDADGEGSDSESEFAAGFISDFVSGEAPRDQRTEWNVRGDRNRAALNQNFARELPLEYRGLLKNYYERVAE